MFADYLSFLEYSFVQRAFLVGILISITCSVFGLFLVLNRMSTMGDGLSHVCFGATALSLLCAVTPIYVTIPIVTLVSLLILKIDEKQNLYKEAAINIISIVSIAAGLMIANFSSESNGDLLNSLFGNILAISTADVYLSVVLTITTLVVVSFFYWDLFSTSFDRELAQTSGVNTKLMNTLLTVLTALTIVLSIKIVGTMLVSALLLLPAFTAMQVAKNFISTVFIAVIVSIASCVIGLSIAIILNLPTSATIVLVNAAAFFLTFMSKFFSRKKIS